MARIGTRRALVSRPAAVSSSSDWWTIAGQTCVAAYQPKGAADLAASYVNLANPGTYNAAPGTAPSFATATGWTFNGSSQYLIVSYALMPAGTGSLFARISDAPSVTEKCIAGWYQAEVEGAVFVGINVSGNTVNCYNGKGYPPGAFATTPTITTGVVGLAGKRVYRDGTIDATSIPAGTGSATPTNLGIGVHTIQIGTPATDFFGGKIQAIAIYSTTLSESDVAALTIRMNAL